MATDEQIHYLGGMIQAALVAADADSCGAVYEYNSQYGEPRTVHPCLELYRVSETIEERGNRGPRIRHVQVALNYYWGPTSKSKFADIFAQLVDAVEVIDDVVTAQELATYESGDDLSTLAGIEDVKINAIRYSYGEGGIGGDENANPMVSMDLTMQHRYVREAVNVEAITSIEGHVNLDNVATGVFGHALDEFKVEP